MVTVNEVLRGGQYAQVPTNLQYDKQLIQTHISDAMKLTVKTILGKEFYNDLISKMNEADCDYSVMPVVKKFPDHEKYELLWTEELYSFCAWAVYQLHLPFGTIQSVSSGLTYNNEHNRDSAIKELKFMMDTTADRLRSKRTLLIQYLKDNADDFPLYKNADTCGEETSEALTFYSGIVLYD